MEGIMCIKNKTYNHDETAYFIKVISLIPSYDPHKSKNSKSIEHLNSCLFQIGFDEKTLKEFENITKDINGSNNVFIIDYIHELPLIEKTVIFKYAKIQKTFKQLWTPYGLSRLSSSIMDIIKILNGVPTV